MKIIRPTTITEAMFTGSTVAEPDTGETAWSATGQYNTGDEAYIGAPTATVTITNASPAVVTWAANGLAVDTPVVFTTSGTLPAGLTAGNTYFVNQILSASTFTVSARKGGRRINTSSAGSGTHTGTAKVHKVYEALQGQKATVTMTIASPAVVTYTAHGLAAATPIVFTTTGALPTGLTAGTTYYVLAPATDTFNVAATAGGAAINTSGSQSGVHTCGLAANYNKAPGINSTVWAYSRPTNKWAMFDQSVSTATDEDGTLRVQLSPGRFNALALLGVDADTVQAGLAISVATCTMTIASPCVVTRAAHGFAADTPIVFSTSGALPTGLAIDTVYYVKSPLTNSFNVSATAGGAAINTSGTQSGTHNVGESVYAYSMDLSNATAVGDWYQYFYNEIYQTDSVTLVDIVDAALIDLPAYGSGVLTLSLTRTGGSVALGVLAVGLYADLGTTLSGTEVSIIDYSRKTTDDFGNVTITERAFSKRMNAQVLLVEGTQDTVANILSTYRATPLVWVGADNDYTSLIVYGFVKDWSIPVVDGSSVLTTKVEGLT